MIDVPEIDGPPHLRVGTTLGFGTGENELVA